MARRNLKSAVVIGALLLASSCSTKKDAATSQLSDGDWPGYGRNAEEQHYSPLTEIDADSVGRLGLAWYYDLPPGNPVSAPIAVDGVLYTVTGYNVVRAFDAAAGKVLWEWDPKTAEVAGRKLRQGWGTKGIAWWDGKIYVGTHEGRLVALDAHTGKEVWSVMTVGKDDYRFIDGAPRVFDGKVIIGHGGADSSDVRGYVTTYDARTGKQLWRFYTVPGNPADGFEDEAQAMAAKTWSGEWWKYGGGGTAWNAFAYDPESRTIFVGVGNGAPWNYRIRSEGKGDNLFLCSILALDADTGKYKWHYQVNPGETWDFSAAMDLHLADIMIGGKLRKVIMQAPKNGFFYVIDRLTGQFISADPLVYQNWAKGIDPKTGRPIERPEARFPDGATAAVQPASNGAHTWLPSSFSPQTGFAYIPVLESRQSLNDKGINYATWKRSPGNDTDVGANLGLALQPSGKMATGALVAWNPATRKQAWRVRTSGGWNGGILTTGGNLLFQGQDNGTFTAYNATSGKALWTFEAGAPVLGPAISYKVKGKQYVTVLSGLGTSVGVIADGLSRPVDYRTQARRVLTFALDAKEALPPSTKVTITAPVDPDYRANAASAMNGAKTFTRCLICHGIGAVAAGPAPDLRASQVPLDPATFGAIVRDGGLVPNGMPRFEELSDQELADLRQYIRSEAEKWRRSPSRGKTEIVW